jgi:hypothetical protein
MLSNPKMGKAPNSKITHCNSAKFPKVSGSFEKCQMFLLNMPHPYGYMVCRMIESAKTMLPRLTGCRILLSCFPHCRCRQIRVHWRNSWIQYPRSCQAPVRGFYNFLYNCCAVVNYLCLKVKTAASSRRNAFEDNYLRTNRGIGLSKKFPLGEGTVRPPQLLYKR